jgi:hypothetical protein
MSKHLGHKPWPNRETHNGNGLHALCIDCERPITLCIREKRNRPVSTFWRHDPLPKWAVEGRAAP